MIHIVESCPLTRFADGDLFRLYSADDGAVSHVAARCCSEGTREMKITFTACSNNLQNTMAAWMDKLRKFNANQQTSSC